MGSGEERQKRPKMKKRKYIIEDVVMKNSKKIEPLLVNFANGQPLEGSELKGRLFHKTDEHGLFTHNMLNIKTPFLNYAGTHHNEQTSGGVSTFLGLVDHNTGKIRLFETSQYTVQPVLKDTAFTSAPSQAPDTISYVEKQEAIAAAFGGKKAKQSVARRRQNRVETETMSSAIDQAAASAADHTLTVAEYLGQQEDVSLLNILPTCDRKATQIQDVYKLEDLTPDNILSLVEEPARALLKSKEFGPKCTVLFREMVENAQHEMKFGSQMRLACVALIVHHLHAFLTCRDQMLRDFEKGKVMKDGCSGVIKWIMREYTVKQGNFITKTKPNEDRALCLSLLLAFISSRYELSVSTLLQSLPVKKDRLNLLMRVIGATYSGPTYSFVLKLPLVQYSQSNKKSKRSKKK